MIALDTNMPTKIRKRRVVYIEDSYWALVEKISDIEHKTLSGALREILKKLV